MDTLLTSSAFIIAVIILGVGFSIMMLVFIEPHRCARAAWPHLQRLYQHMDLGRLPLDGYRHEMQKMCYNQCATHELLDVFRHIDRQAHPQRFRALLLAISEHVAGPMAEDDDDLVVLISDDEPV